jgi:rare lipoprotein A
MKQLLLIGTLMTTAFAASPAAQKAPRAEAKGETGTQIASFYSTRFDGRTTASGQKFNSKLLTAASRDLPFGSKVRITNLANQRSVVVRVNDRGPFVRGRDISVTRRAARQLGFIKAGTARVSVTPVS